jgi:chromosome segregation ATPase
MRLGPRKLVVGGLSLVALLVAGLAWWQLGTPGLLGVVFLVVLAAAVGQAYLLVELGRRLGSVAQRRAEQAEQRARQTDERARRTDERLDAVADDLERARDRAATQGSELAGLLGQLQRVVANQDELLDHLRRMDTSLEELAGRVERPSEHAEQLLRAVHAGFRRIELELASAEAASASDQTQGT